MRPDPSTDCPVADADPREPAFAHRIAAAWDSGSLLPAADGPARPLTGCSLIGTGESYAVWELEAPRHPRMVVRVPWHGTCASAREALRCEATALGMIPPRTGPRVLALHEDCALLGRPALVLTRQPGRALPPSAWTREHLLAHARGLAGLHRVEMPGRGPLPSDGVTPMPAEPLASITGAVAREFAQARKADAALIAAHRLEPLLEAALARVEAADWGGARRLMITHGDACATNILWDGRAPHRSSPHLIDFEWAMADDPARDLAIIAGPVHGGPWYVPAAEDDVRDMVRAYAQALAEHGIEEDADALWARVPAWWAYERTAMLLHALRRAESGSARHREAATTLRRTLTRLLAG